MIDDTLVSEELKTICFSCDLSQCKGDCCVQGDAGAPLEEEEIAILEDYLEEIKPFMTRKGLEVVGKNGVFDYDTDGEYVTPLVNDLECAFVYFKNGISYCAIEKAWFEEKTDFQKPISCHLYPIRLSKLKHHTAINYNRWDICQTALLRGKQDNIQLYKYLKDPLTRKFGESWYRKLTQALENDQIK